MASAIVDRGAESANHAASSAAVLAAMQSEYHTVNRQFLDQWNEQSLQGILETSRNDCDKGVHDDSDEEEDDDGNIFYISQCTSAKVVQELQQQQTVQPSTIGVAAMSCLVQAYASDDEDDNIPSGLNHTTREDLSNELVPALVKVLEFTGVEVRCGNRSFRFMFEGDTPPVDYRVNSSIRKFVEIF